MTEDRKRGRVRFSTVRPSAAQVAYLRRGLEMPGGKLPLFDRDGQRYRSATIRSCMGRGWAEPWLPNPTNPEWLVCKLTAAGRDALALAHAMPGGVRMRGPFGQARDLQLYLRAAL